MPETAVAIWLIGVVATIVLIAPHLPDPSRLNGNEMLGLSIVVFTWPAIFALVLVFTVLFSISWCLLPTIRQRGSFVEGVKDFWS